MLTSQYDAIALTDEDYFQDFCLSVSSDRYLCQATKLHFFPTTRHTCILNLAVHNIISDSCKFRHVDKKLEIQHISPFHYIFSWHPITVTLQCEKEKPVLREVQGNLRVNEECGVLAPDLFTIFPSHTQDVAARAFVPHTTKILLREFDIADVEQKAGGANDDNSYSIGSRNNMGRDS